MKKLIVSSECFGWNHDFNRAILNGSNNGFLTNARIIANGEAFDSALYEIAPECPNVSFGINLNITKGKSLTRCTYITDNDRNFNKNLFTLIKLSKNKNALIEIENEFRAQIEKIIMSATIKSISSVDFVHEIPSIFKIVCKLAKQYKIDRIITHSENLILPTSGKYLCNYKLYKNIPTLALINKYSHNNKKYLLEQNILTNDYFISNLYAGLFNNNIIETILKNYSDKKFCTVELSLKPVSYLRDQNDTYSREFKITQDRLLEDNINRLGFDITNYKN